MCKRLLELVYDVCHFRRYSTPICCCYKFFSYTSSFSRINHKLLQFLSIWRFLTIQIVTFSSILTYLKLQFQQNDVFNKAHCIGPFFLPSSLFNKLCFRSFLVSFSFRGVQPRAQKFWPPLVSCAHISAKKIRIKKTFFKFIFKFF